MSGDAKKKKSAGAKQDPHEKRLRQLAADGRVYFSYAMIHQAVSSCVPRVRAFDPDVIVAIGGGGFIPARMLRSEVRRPILAVTLRLYDDGADGTAREAVETLQWYDGTSGVGRAARGGRVLIVDEVDDTRKTLAYCVERVRRTSAPAAIAVMVVHNKVREKLAELPPDVEYIAAEDVPDTWNCYPWDAASYGRDIFAHEALARECLGREEKDNEKKEKKKKEEEEEEAEAGGGRVGNRSRRKEQWQ